MYSAANASLTVWCHTHTHIQKRIQNTIIQSQFIWNCSIQGNKACALKVSYIESCSKCTNISVFQHNRKVFFHSHSKTIWRSPLAGSPGYLLLNDDSGTLHIPLFCLPCPWVLVFSPELSTFRQQMGKRKKHKESQEFCLVRT